MTLGTATVAASDPGHGGARGPTMIPPTIPGPPQEDPHGVCKIFVLSTDETP